MPKQTLLFYVKDVIRAEPNPPRNSRFSKILKLIYTSYSGRYSLIAGIFILLVCFFIFYFTEIKTTQDMIIAIFLGLFIGGLGILFVLGGFLAALKVHKALKIGIVADARVVKAWEARKKVPPEKSPPGSAFVAQTVVSHSEGYFEQNLDVLDRGEGGPKSGDTIFVLVHPTRKKVLVHYQTLWEYS